MKKGIESENKLQMAVLSLTEDFDIILLADFENKSVEVIKSTDEFETWIKSSSTNGYDDYQKSFASKYIDEAERAWFLSQTNLAKITERLKNEKAVWLDFVLKRDSSAEFFQLEFSLNSSDKTGSTFFVAVHSIDDVRRRDISLEKGKMVIHHNAVISSLARDYDYISYIDFENEEIIRYRASDYFLAVVESIPKNLPSNKRLDLFFNKIVLPEDKKEFLSAVNHEKIKKAMTEKGSYEAFFRLAIDEDDEKYYAVKLVKDYTYPQNVIMGIQNLDDEVRSEIRREEQDAALRVMEKQLELTISERTAEIQAKNLVLNRINDDIIELLGDVTEARDLESGEHIRRVKGLTFILARQIMKDWPEYGLTDEMVEMIASASALHDIGKIVIPDAILLKPGKLTTEEFAIMKTHSEKGCEILERAPRDWSEDYLKVGMDICRYHHEKYDGKGYPCGLKGEDIPISAQIVSVADCFDALTTKRVYKDAYSPEQAYDMILNGECGAFSDKIMKSFKRCRDEYIKRVTQTTGTFIKEKIMTKTKGSLVNSKILYVEDDHLDREIGKEILTEEGAEVTAVSSGQEALDLLSNAETGTFDAILMDVIMRGMDGPEAASRIRKLGTFQAETIPIIALTSSNNEEDVQRCLDAGMNSYLTKPISMQMLTRALIKSMREQSEVLQQRLNAAVKLTVKDSLTGVKNIAAYTDMVEKLTDEIKENPNVKFAMVECDINELAKTNDTYGHQTGDVYIRNCCNIICSVFKHSPVYRIGGDEFVAILKDEDYDNHDRLMEELRERVEEATHLKDIEHGRASFAAGMAAYDKKKDKSISTVIKRTNTALENNKKLMKFRGL